MAGVPTPRLDGTQLVALIVESLFYGFFFVLWVQCIDALTKRSAQRGERFISPLSVTAIILLFTITGHWVLDCARAYQAFVLAQDHYNCDPSLPNAATIVYSHDSDPKVVVNSALYVITTIVGDAFMVYRLFIVWHRNWWVIIAPVTFMVALAVTGSLVTYNFSKAIPIFRVQGWITASFVMTLLANLSSTSLIAFRIWLSHRRFERHSYSTAKVVEMIVQSAAIYSCCLIIALITYEANSNIQFVAVCVNSTMVGIIFCMIVLRSYGAATISLPSAPDNPRSLRFLRKDRPSAEHQLNSIRPPVCINIVKELEVDGRLNDALETKSQGGYSSLSLSSRPHDSEAQS